MKLLMLLQVFSSFIFSAKFALVIAIFTVGCLFHYADDDAMTTNYLFSADNDLSKHNFLPVAAFYTAFALVPYGCE